MKRRHSGKSMNRGNKIVRRKVNDIVKYELRTDGNNNDINRTVEINLCPWPTKWLMGYMEREMDDSKLIF